MSRREPPLADRLAALRDAVEIAEGRLEVPEVAAARALLAKAGARAALGRDPEPARCPQADRHPGLRLRQPDLRLPRGH